MSPPVRIKAPMKRGLLRGTRILPTGRGTGQNKGPDEEGIVTWAAACEGASSATSE